jgi:hypothetical protein
MKDNDFFERTAIADTDFLNDPMGDAADDAFRLMVHVSKYLDTEFGKGFSSKHPDIVASITQSASMFHLAERIEKLMRMEHF